jgi:hypothetical protein
VCALLARPAHADPSACSNVAVAVQVDAQVARNWPELSGDVRQAFAERDGVERCATVKLGRAETGIDVQVLLADGRSAERRVQRAEDVVPVLEAMLVVPDELEAAPAALPTSSPEDQRAPPAKRAPAPSPTPSSKSQPSPRVAAPAAHGQEQDATASDVHGSGAGIELSAATSARVGDGQYSVGLGVTTLLELRQWLAGLAARVDSFAVPEGQPHAALELGVLLGRRFQLDPVTLDLLLGPAVALQGESTVETGPAGERTETTSGVVPRLQLASRLNFAPRSTLRPFLGIEGELGPGQDTQPESIASIQAMPQWIVGFAVGATVGTR